MEKNGIDKVKVFALIVAIFAGSLSLVNFATTRDLQMQFLYLNKLQYAPRIKIVYLNFEHYNYSSEYKALDWKITLKNIGETNAELKRIFCLFYHSPDFSYEIERTIYDFPIEPGQILNFSGRKYIDYDTFSFIKNLTKEQKEYINEYGRKLTYADIMLNITYYDTTLEQNKHLVRYIYYDILEKKVIIN